MLSIAVDEIPEVGQENEKVPVDDNDPDIQGSESPGSMNTNISGKKSFLEKYEVKTLGFCTCAILSPDLA